MNHDTDITEVSDPRELTIDAPSASAVEQIRIVNGEPTEEELAALVAVLSATVGGPVEPGPQELNLWGHPVDKLRYPSTSWQRVTLLERTYMRR